MQTRWVAVTVFLVGVALRLYGLGEWSLWEDEETTIFFSYHPNRPFPRAFPTYFLMLGRLFDYTGCSVLAGRLLSAAFGIGSLALTYGIARRFVGPSVALTALAVTSVSPAHLFWSQSIRYYSLVYVLLLAAAWLVLEGNRRSRTWMILLALATIRLAVSCHTSALLFMPVLFAYQAWLAWRRPSRWRLGVLALLSVIFALGTIQLWTIMRKTLTAGDGWRVESARDPWHLLVTGAFYFGPPALALAAIGMWHVWRTPERERFGFFVLLAALPLTLLAGLAVLNTVNVTYYYGLIALAGLAVLAGAGVEATATWRPTLRYAAAVAAVAYYVAVLGAYLGPSYGDRPRWREAALYVAAHRASDLERTYASVPGVIAFYLGVPPDQTMGHPMVQRISEPLPALGDPAWFVSERRVLPFTVKQQLEAACRQAASFPATMLGRDRSVVVYRCGPS